MDKEADFIAALQEITHARGRFHHDPEVHHRHCIEDMQMAAIEVLKRHGIEPEGKPVA